MQHNIIERLFNSFSELEQAIESARVTLGKRATSSPQLMERLNSYGGIIAKQRNLATDLCRHISDGNWDEVSRHVSLINGLSAMIRDDARAILASVAAAPNSEEASEDEMNFC